jgi:hypothetical protein
MHEPISYLLHLCESFNYIGIGSSGEYIKAGTKELDASCELLHVLVALLELAIVVPRHVGAVGRSCRSELSIGSRRACAWARIMACAHARGLCRDQSAGAAADHQLKRPLLGRSRRDCCRHQCCSIGLSTKRSPQMINRQELAQAA